MPVPQQLPPQFHGFSGQPTFAYPAPELQPPQPQPQQQIQPPASNRYLWAPRKERMNWKTAEAIDIQQIWASHDLRSVLFYLKKIVNVTITKDDLANFKTRGALNAFLILQLGVDYLLSETRRLEAEVGRDSPQTTSVYVEQIAEFNRQIDAANRDIARRDATIRECNKKLEEIRVANRRDKDMIRERQARLKAAEPARDSDSDDEPGAIPDFPRKWGRPERQQQSCLGTTDDEASSGEQDAVETIQRVVNAHSPDNRRI
jgi:hypothetical protein